MDLLDLLVTASRVILLTTKSALQSVLWFWCKKAARAMWLNPTWTSILPWSRAGGNTKSRLCIERTRTRNRTRLEWNINIRSSLGQTHMPGTVDTAVNLAEMSPRSRRRQNCAQLQHQPCGGEQDVLAPPQSMVLQRGYNCIEYVRYSFWSIHHFNTALRTFNGPNIHRTVPTETCRCYPSSRRRQTS